MAAHCLGLVTSSNDAILCQIRALTCTPSSFDCALTQLEACWQVKASPPHQLALHCNVYARGTIHLQLLICSAFCSRPCSASLLSIATLRFVQVVHQLQRTLLGASTCIDLHSLQDP